MGCELKNNGNFIFDRFAGAFFIRKMYLFFMFLIFCSFSFPARVSAASIWIDPSNNVTYSYVDVLGGVRIVDVNASTVSVKSIVFPSSINGKKVVELGGGTKSLLTGFDTNYHISISNCITNVTKINKNAFNGATCAINGITFNHDIFIGDNAFRDCSDIGAVQFSGNGSTVSHVSVGSQCFDNTYISNLNVEGTEFNGDACFAGARLGYVYYNITDMCDNCFYNAVMAGGSGTINLGPSLRNINRQAMANVTNLKKITGGDSVVSIGYCGMAFNTSLTTLGNGTSAANLYLRSKYNDAVVGCPNIKTTDIIMTGEQVLDQGGIWTGDYTAKVLVSSWATATETAEWHLDGTAVPYVHPESCDIFGGANKFTAAVWYNYCGYHFNADLSLYDLGVVFTPEGKLSSAYSNLIKTTGSTRISNVKNGFSRIRHSSKSSYTVEGGARPSISFDCDPTHAYAFICRTGSIWQSCPTHHEPWNSGADAVIEYSWLHVQGFNEGTGYVQVWFPDVAATYKGYHYDVFRKGGPLGNSYQKVYTVDNPNKYKSLYTQYDGRNGISSLAVGESVKKLTAQDWASPKRPTATYDNATGNVKIKATDVGSDYSYYFTVRNNSGQLELNQSNIASATVKTGVHGFYIYRDNSPSTVICKTQDPGTLGYNRVVDCKGAVYISAQDNVELKINVNDSRIFGSLNPTGTYLHIAAVDGAPMDGKSVKGNISETVHLSLTGSGYFLNLNANGGSFNIDKSATMSIGKNKTYKDSIFNVVNSEFATVKLSNGSNNGSIVPPGTGSGTSALVYPSWAGSFLGWSLNQAGTQMLYSNQGLPATGNVGGKIYWVADDTVGYKYQLKESVTVYAQYAPKGGSYVIRYHSNTPANELKTEVYSDASEADVILAGNTFKSPGANVDKVSGWSLSSGENNPYAYGEGDVFTVSQFFGSKKVVDLYARWQTQSEIGYSVEYNPNTGSGTVNGHNKVALGSSIKLKDNTFTPPTGYHKADGWSRSPGVEVYYRNQTGNTKQFSEGQTVDNITLNVGAGGTVTLYARWEPNKYKVHYVPNAEDALTSGTPNPTEVKYTYPIDVSTKIYRGSRTGWDFMGWHTNPDSTSVLNSLYMERPEDYYLYAIFKRNFNLYTAVDNVGHINAKAHEKVIYTHTPSFRYNDSGFLSDTTRSAVTYKVTFKKNGDSQIIGQGEYKETNGKYIGSYNKLVGTDLKSDNTIDATRYFDGWYSKDDSDHQCDFGGTRYGGSATYMNIAVKPYDADHYDFSGEAGSLANVLCPNRTGTIYPIYDKAYIYLPDAKRGPQSGGSVSDPGPDGKLPNGEGPDKFVGWFTNPQYDDSGNLNYDGGIYFGRTGDLVEITSDVTLYPWFNIAPRIIHSVLGRDLEGNDILAVSTNPKAPSNVLHKGFYENQSVTYGQLMSLIYSYDVDNPKEEGPEGLVTYNTVTSWTDIVELQQRTYLDTYYPDLSDAQKDALVKSADNDYFRPVLTKVEYFGNGQTIVHDKATNTVSYGKNIPAAVKSSSLVYDVNGNTSFKLDTSQSNIGNIILYYQVTDNGMWTKAVSNKFGNVRQKVLKSNGYSVDSPITVDFWLHTGINYNVLPKVVTRGITMYSTDTSITSDGRKVDGKDTIAIEDLILQKQDATDMEDDNEFLPWWMYDTTHKNLDDTLVIKWIRDGSMKFDSGYYDKHKTECDNLAKIKSVKELFGYKDRNEEIFNYILSFEVELDCVDQWGKHASGRYGEKYGLPSDEPGGDPSDPDPHRPSRNYPYKYDEIDPNDPDGQTSDDRTAEIILLNNHTDPELADANTGGSSGVSTDSKVRYINGEWLDSLSDSSYWGNEGEDSLRDTLNKKNTDSSKKYEGTVNNNGSNVKITVNDYTTN